MWGGREGLDITEAEPFRNTKIGTTFDELNNYTHYSLYKAIDAARDPEVVPANLLLAPGINQPIITDKLISTAESRRDVLAILDLEHDYTQSAESTANQSSRLGSVTSAISSIKSRNLNSSFACAFYPAVQITDNLNVGSPRVWIPSSVAALGAFASSQAKTDVWFAPAGFNRGGLGSLGGRRGPRVIQARQRLDSRERDDLYQVNINPIATFPAEGVVVFGQKTLQADQSALDRINVRRLVLYLKSRVAGVARNLLFDPNVSTTWGRFKAQVNPILSDAKARFGLSDYKLILDETTTTPDLIDRNIMYAKIFIKPARAIEFIVVDFVITKTGADFA
jgi:phage tail sheath protein FI